MLEVLEQALRGVVDVVERGEVLRLCGGVEQSFANQPSSTTQHSHRLTYLTLVRSSRHNSEVKQLNA